MDDAQVAYRGARRVPRTTPVTSYLGNRPGGSENLPRRGERRVGPSAALARALAWNNAPMTSSSRVSARLGAIAPSATLAVDAKAKALKAAGRPVIGFGAGEPDFPTPQHIVEAAVEAARDPKNHRYTPAAGLPELKQAIADKTLRDSGYEVDPATVLVTNGGKQAVFQAFAAILDPGDEVILPAPYWTTYPEAIALTGASSVEVFAGADQGYLVTVEQARGRAHRQDQGAAVLLAVQPDRRRLLPGADQGHRRVGAGARHLGHHRRDLRAPPVRRRAVHAHPA
ncbi:hypothetical protein GCM10025876_23710 [Demequina litorisediminis]|uniref:Aminotransferase class I/classII large domain-containing protein n=1 Tax=Demequina litorisediminis TaxID=1849022 RepID=A0ABQ6IG79_9MICO|nr:hypothetical protein GCM10025876_23710 [Demequina litorisediminis]